jgi:DNA processing protein
MTAPAELRALLEIRAIPGIGDVRLTALLRRHGSPARALEAIRAERPDAAARLGAPGVAGRIDNALRSILEAKDIRAVAAHEPDYPAALLDLHDPPPLIFVRGHFGLLDRDTVAIVGTRACTEYGADAAREIARSLAGADIVVASGLAHGVDRHAHEAALDAGGVTLAVIGCGIDVVYPRQHQRLYERIARDGLLVSEFLPGEPALPHHFPRRNRIIAALSRAVVVVEAPARSGALITAEHALDLGREVFAVPGPIGRRTSEGTNALIRDGASMVNAPDDVVRWLAEQLVPVGERAGNERESIVSRIGMEEPASPLGHPRGATSVPDRDRGSARGAVGGGPANGRIRPPTSNAGPRTAGSGGRGSHGTRSARRTGPAAAIEAGLSDDPAHVDDLARAAGLDAAITLASLLELELAGIAVVCAGGRYRRRRNRSHNPV